MRVDKVLLNSAPVNSITMYARRFGVQVGIQYCLAWLSSLSIIQDEHVNISVSVDKRFGDGLERGFGMLAVTVELFIWLLGPCVSKYVVELASLFSTIFVE